MTTHDQTIAALSTPPGESALAVVRMSGGDALDILSRVFRTPSGRAPAGDWEHRRLYHGVIHDGEERVDEVMCAVMRAPESYTGEDVVEVSCHGGGTVVARILAVLYAAGARPAEAGEFTKRAFLAGKMDLIQAEAVADVIHAQSELQRAVAQRQLSGSLSRRIDALADEALVLLGNIEANIDFIEEDIDALDVPAALATLDRHRAELDAILAGAEFSRPFRDGYRVAVAGPVNAGKSSLFNRLLGESRAIVTEIPGTTRDVLREALVLRGLVFVFHDTAGLRSGRTDAQGRPDVAADPVESIGIDRAAGAVQSADAVLFVVDASVPLDDGLAAALGALDPSRAVVVLNKSDLPARVDAGAVKSLGARVECVTLSALTGAGVDELVGALVSMVGGERLVSMARERVVLNARLVSLLTEAAQRTEVLRRSLEARRPLELMAVEAREVLLQYEHATGRRYDEGLLDTIFSRFCIGK